MSEAESRFWFGLVFLNFGPVVKEPLIQWAFVILGLLWMAWAAGLWYSSRRNKISKIAQKTQ